MCWYWPSNEHFRSNIFLLFLFVQMTVQEVRLCGLLLQEHFGEVVEKVGTLMLKNGTQNLRTILNETGISVDLVSVYFSSYVFQTDYFICLAYYFHKLNVMLIYKCLLVWMEAFNRSLFCSRLRSLCVCLCSTGPVCSYQAVKDLGARLNIKPAVIRFWEFCAIHVTSILPKLCMVTRESLS